MKPSLPKPSCPPKPPHSADLPRRPPVDFDSHIPELIHTLYATLSSPQGFHPFLESLVQRVNGCAAQLSTIRKSPIQLEHLWYSGLSDEFISWYLDNNMIEHDVVSNHAITQAPGQFQAASSLLDQYDLTEDYNRWESEQDMLDSAWLLIEASESTVTLLTIQRTVAQGIYHPSELDTLNQLTPYIRQTVQLHRHLSDKQKTGHSLQFLFNHFSDATFVLDDRANVLYSNTAAQHLMSNEDCLSISCDRFNFNQPQLQNDFVRSSIRVARASVGKEEFYAHSIFLPRHDKAPLTILIRPLESHELLSGGAIVTIFDRSSRALPRAEDIASYFSLSPAESSLCEGLISGLSLKDIATRQNKKEATLRTYLKTVFRKTGSHSQGQLVSHILSALLY